MLSGVSSCAHTALPQTVPMVIVTWWSHPPALKASEPIVQALQAAAEHSSCKLIQIIFGFSGQEH